MSNKGVNGNIRRKNLRFSGVVEIWKAGYNRSGTHGVFVKVRAKPLKNTGVAKAAELLPAVIEGFGRLILGDRSSDSYDVDNVWFFTVRLLMRSCSLRFAFEADSWESLLTRRRDFLQINETQLEPALLLLSAVDDIAASMKCDDPDQSLSTIYSLVLNMVPRLELDGFGNKRLIAKRIEKFKKRSGSFYSPAHLVKLTVERALAPLVFDSNSGELKSLDEILNLKILDPALGAGVFLIHSYKYLVDAIPTITKEQGRQIACRGLYGVDVDPLAVEVARLSLWLTIQDYELDPDLDFPNLRVGNSLIGARSGEFGNDRSRLEAGAPRVAARRTFDEVVAGKEGGASCLVDDQTKSRLDDFCADWFLPAGSSNGLEATKELEAIARREKFFHWQFEFPEVFRNDDPPRSGFDAVIGNPPWEIVKPNSREFFGMVDSEFWSLGKQDALAAQKQLLAIDSQLSREWTDVQEQHKRFAKWIKNAPAQLDGTAQAFEHQGSGDLNLYKLFCEQSFHLTREGGSIALIVPSGLYSDSGARELRRLLLEKTDWNYLNGFDNSDSAFNIHRSFKYCIFAAIKGGDTIAIKTSFLGQQCVYNRETIAALSPKWLVLSEVENKETLVLLDQINENSTLLASTEYGGNRLGYAREFDMTIDSHRFQTRDRLESQSYVQDVYGNWLLGKWRTAGGTSKIADLNAKHNKVGSSCGRFLIDVEDVRDVYVPLYEGRMIGQFTANEKQWKSGKGRRAVWEPSDGAFLGPQYLIPKSALLESGTFDELKVGFLAVGCATNARTMIAACLSSVACGNSVPVLRFHVEKPLETLSATELQLALTGFFNSFVFDFVIRRKMAGNNLNYFVLEECPLPKLIDSNISVFKTIANLVAQLNFGHLRFCRELHQMGFKQLPSLIQNSPQSRMLRSYIDVLVAHLYGLNLQDLNLILSDTILHSEKINTKSFFRIDRDLEPQERLPALVLRHAAEMETIGVSCFVERINSIATLEQVNFDGEKNNFSFDIAQHANLLNSILMLP
jgi:hypothetical protein